LANFTSINKGTHACLGQTMPIFVHARAERCGFNSNTRRNIFLISHAGLLYGFAIP
jgi:hypothetical protein